MDLLNLIVEEFYTNGKEIPAKEVPEGYGVPVSPVVSYFCFGSPLDMEYYKDDTLKEELLLEKRNPEKELKKRAEGKAKSEIKSAKKGKTSEETGTVYKLTSEQKRALKFIKKKYGRKIAKEIKTFRTNFLAPYQVIKNNLEKSKSIYLKDILGMTKDEYLRNKKSAEFKIENMRSNKYSDMTKEFYNLKNRTKGINELEALTKGEINQTALRKVFEKYNIKTGKFSNSDFEAFKKRTDDIDRYIDLIVDRVKSGLTLYKGDVEFVEKKKAELEALRKKLISKKRAESQSSSKKNPDEIAKYKKVINSVEEITDFIRDSDIDEKEKINLIKRYDKQVKVNGENITSKTFQDEYEMYLIRLKIEDQIKNNEKNKYTEEYIKQLSDSKERYVDRKSDLLDRMARERSNKFLTDKEKNIYKLKPGAPYDSDNLNDYTLKIKEKDFFDAVFFNKSEEMRNAERKIDAEIKRFERALQAKMDDRDFKLLKKYRLINNLLTVKDLKNIKELFAESV